MFVASRAKTQRRAAALPTACAAAVGLLMTGCGGTGPSTDSSSSAETQADGSSHGTSPHRSTAPATTAPGPAPLLRLTATTKLPEAVQLPAVTAGAGGVLALAGLDAADSSLAAVTLIEGSKARTVAQLPHALHDGAAATVGGHAYLFGGGDAGAASSSILAVDRSGAHVAGRLPAPSSDVAAATIDDTAYVVGGYTETMPLRTI
ncbi:MAG TPA: hypothetical protein VK774_03645, partial [Solirubrobacteraceae bacterium]|nr:hypothetical protein [Solirubrobacteraceae bacterium]